MKNMSKVIYFVVIPLFMILRNVEGRSFYKSFENNGDGIIKIIAHGNNPVNVYCAASYNQSYMKVGWDQFEVQTSPDGQTDDEQAECAGLLEGMVTVDAIYNHYYNNVRNWCKGRQKTCRKVAQFLDQHFTWIEQSIQDSANNTELWHHVSVFYSHLKGLHKGYNEVQKDPNKYLTMSDFIMMNFQNDLDDVAAALEGDVRAKARGETRCSALIKLIPRNEDILVAHDTWNSYVGMYRMLKKYEIPLHKSSQSKELVPGQVITFSGYPGVITSGDDFYITSSKLIALETTIGNSNASLWQNVQPTGQLFETMRSMIALRLANNGLDWCNTFSQLNSGTYNNQWMIVDLKQFKKSSQPKNGTLYILEQIPSYIRFEDLTSVLINQTYWPSYNVPYFTDVFNMSGNQELVDQYGDWFTYEKTPRALIFKRNHTMVTDLDSLMKLMRDNDYKHDPYSKCNCTPPYSAENAIAARSDLNPKHGSYPFESLGHRCHGAVDAKVTSLHLAKNLYFSAVCGPTTGTDLPAFQWDKSDFKHLPHIGQPNAFTNFTPIVPVWYGPFF